ncbi:MAG: hypothetical protein LBQ33_02255 [Oscillospiraceae bacterium]|jgi:hypothetical protein|nr:hypothetical protein [Oscillospiraceae bacterium]
MRIADEAPIEALGSGIRLLPHERQAQDTPTEKAIDAAQTHRVNGYQSCFLTARRQKDLSFAG